MKRSLTLLALSFSLFACDPATNPPSSRIKRVVRLNIMDTKFLQLDDGSQYGMGENLFNRLTTVLENSNHFVVLVEENLPKALAKKSYDPSDRLHFDFAPIPAADFRASVEGLSFTHGSRGTKRFAGYNSDFHTPWNDGSFGNKNEFPPRSLEMARSWFGTSFNPIGNETENTISGVDAGEEGEMNLLIGDIHYRRDKFFAQARVHTELRLLAENIVSDRNIDANGSGFLFAMGLGWNGISVEFGIKRNDALKQTFDYEVDGIARDIQTQLEKIPFRTRVESYGEQGIILNAGRREGIRVGDIFVQKTGDAITTLKVMESFQIGSRVEVVNGGGSSVQQGDIVTLREPGHADTHAISPKGTEKHTVQNSTITLDPPEFSSADNYANHGLQAKSSMLLPWLLDRWAQYDQDIKTRNDIPARNNLVSKAKGQWNTNMIQIAEAWSKAGTMGDGVKVAIIDSGVDYNHNNLYDALDRKNVGWDFMSFDERPFDDNSHGTAIAGIIAAQGIGSEAVGIAPHAKLLAYKIFNPYGETTSAALYAAFDRAIKDGARIIVTAWSTQNKTACIEAAIQLAEQYGVLVVTGAGDRGDDLTKNPYYPAILNTHNNVITVSALNASGALSTMSGRYSNYGAGIVDIAAPGENLSVLAPRSLYINRSGTDLAAAHVAGVAALLAAKNPGAKASDIKQALLSACTQQDSLSGVITRGCVLNAAQVF